MPVMDVETVVAVMVVVEVETVVMAVVEVDTVVVVMAVETVVMAVHYASKPPSMTIKSLLFLAHSSGNINLA